MEPSSQPRVVIAKPSASFYALPRELQQDILLRTFTDHQPAEFIAKTKNHYLQNGLPLSHRYHVDYGISLFYKSVRLGYSLGIKAVTTRIMILKTAAVFDPDDIEYVGAVWRAGLDNAVVKAQEMYEKLRQSKINDPIEYERLLGHATR